MSVNQNGQMILKVLQQYSEPATFMQINNKLAQILRFNPKDTRHDVKSVLEAGVRSGYIQYQRNRYFVLPLNIPGLTKPPSADGINAQPQQDTLDNGDGNEPTDTAEGTSTEVATAGKPETSCDPNAAGPQPESGAQNEPQQDTSMGVVRRGRSRNRKLTVGSQMAITTWCDEGGDGVNVRSRSVGGARHGSAGVKERAGRKRKASKSSKGGKGKKRSPAKGRSKSRSKSRSKGRKGKGRSSSRRR